MITLPLRTGPDIDWRSKCHPGDSQGETDACTVFAIANWIECMTGDAIRDDATIALWREERMFRHGNLDGGLTVTEAFFAIYRAGWLPRGTTIRRVRDLQYLEQAPLVLSLSGLEWSIPPGTNTLSKIRPDSNHAVLAVADIAGEIWIENSHGPRWGDNGFGRMLHEVCGRHTTQVWQIVLPATKEV